MLVNAKSVDEQTFVLQVVRGVVFHWDIETPRRELKT